MNVYVYVHNNPINFVDPVGLNGKKVIQEFVEYMHGIPENADFANWAKKFGVNVHDKEWGTIMPKPEHRLRSAAGVHTNRISQVTGKKTHWNKKWNKWREQWTKRMQKGGRGPTPKDFRDHYRHLRKSRDFKKQFKKAVESPVDYKRYRRYRDSVSRARKKAGGSKLPGPLGILFLAISIDMAMGEIDSAREDINRGDFEGGVIHGAKAADAFIGIQTTYELSKATSEGGMWAGGELRNLNPHKFFMEHGLEGLAEKYDEDKTYGDYIDEYVAKQKWAVEALDKADALSEQTRKQFDRYRSHSKSLRLRPEVKEAIEEKKKQAGKAIDEVGRAAQEGKKAVVDSWRSLWD